MINAETIKRLRTYPWGQNDSVMVRDYPALADALETMARFVLEMDSDGFANHDRERHVAALRLASAVLGEEGE